MVQPIPGSLSEGAAERSEAEGVSSDGCSMPMVYSQVFIDSEIFERLRSSGYTPSLREPGNVPHNVNPPPAGCCVSGRGIFVGSVWGAFFPFNRGLAKPEGYGRFSSPLRNSGCLSAPIHRGTLPQGGSRGGLYHSTHRSETGRLRAIFIAPTKTQKALRCTMGNPPAGGGRGIGGVSPGLGLRWTGPIPRGFWGRRR